MWLKNDTEHDVISLKLSDESWWHNTKRNIALVFLLKQRYINSKTEGACIGISTDDGVIVEEASYLQNLEAERKWELSTLSNSNISFMWLCWFLKVI